MNAVTILLADDDSDDSEMFCEAVAEIDPTVTCIVVENGRMALEYLLNPEKIRPQVIFLDINMPVVGGWDCLKAIKKTEGIKDIPVIMISTASDRRTTTKTMELGALCLFSKPEDFTMLTKIIGVIIHNYKNDLLPHLKPFPLIHFNAIG